MNKMVRKPKITTLKELKTRKKEVRMETELAKREFAHSVGTTRENASNFAVKKIALPAGGAVAGLFVLSKLFSSNKNKQQVIKETKVVHEYPDGTPYDGKKRGPGKPRKSRLKRFTGLVGAIRVLIPVIQAIIGAFQTHKAQEQAKRAKKAAVKK